MPWDEPAAGRPLTILQVAYPLAPVGPDAAGGAEQILFHLDAELTARGHRSIVLACAGSSVSGTLATIPACGSEISAADHAQAILAYRAMIPQLAAAYRIDLVHLHGIDCSRYLPPAELPSLATLHLPPSWYPAEMLAGEHPNLSLCCVSEAQRGACPPDARVTAVVRNGIPTERLAGSFAKRDYVLALGRICPEKGFDIALDAARRTGVALLLAGPVFGYAAHQAHFRQEIEPRLDRWRRYLGPVGFRAKRRLLSGARCLVVPSQVEETSCLVAWEALACGTPVVGFRRGALPEAVREGETGFLVERPEELPGAIEAAASLDPESCRAAARIMSTSAMADRYLALYRRLLDRGVSVRAA